MNENHKRCFETAIKKIKEARKNKKNNDFFTANLDGNDFVAEEVHKFSSFGVNMVVGVKYIDNGRSYISFAADEGLEPGAYEVSEEGVVTIGYMVEVGDEAKEYPAVEGQAIIVDNKQSYVGEFNVTLTAGAPYRKINDAKYKAV